MNSNITNAVRNHLATLADKKIEKSLQHFFKDPVKAYGIKTAVVKKFAKETGKSLNTESKETIFAVCEELWQSGIQEEIIIACDWCFAQRKKYEQTDFYIFKKWIENYVTNWAACDSFCNNCMGAVLMQFPDLLVELIKWTNSPNRWMRRAAAVSLIVPARKGLFIQEIITIATKLLQDSNDLVQKGYGWLLKEASKKHQPAVYNFVLQNKTKMPRTALRYSIEKMPPDIKNELM